MEIDSAPVAQQYRRRPGLTLGRWVSCRRSKDIKEEINEMVFDSFTRRRSGASRRRPRRHAETGNKSKLQGLLTHHVVPGKVMSRDAVKLNSTKTAQESTTKIKAMDTSVMVNDAHVVKPDIPASNGGIHVIDKVILPE
jgi:uncharacterized surface protein with fasciclin (FAS1) repeats